MVANTVCCLKFHPAHERPLNSFYERFLILFVYSHKESASSRIYTVLIICVEVSTSVIIAQNDKYMSSFCFNYDIFVNSVHGDLVYSLYLWIFLYFSGSDALLFGPGVCSWW